ncbi:hypothetical protein TRICI_003880 [Trichomonascus ciferrii]|uniref:Ubiquitin-like domain-containing protein n=1 Tax=Trichomonascus ciferrii TaxID=44093 RepID=A0A642V7J8_9ASCO|nr:hypothetical protein TRICI_003880 [Trichomonascus ciferrii]
MDERLLQIRIVFTDKLELGRQSVYEVVPEDSVAELKRQIMEAYPVSHPGPAVARQMLIYRGRVLEDSATFSKVLSDDDSSATFHLIVRPAAGESVPANDPPSRSTPTRITAPTAPASTSSSASSMTSSTTTASSSTSSTASQPQPEAGPPAGAVPVNAIREPLHIIHLKVPTESGEKRISIPCYDYMFVPAYNGQMAFCLSPSALMKLSSLGVPVEVPPLYAPPQQATPTSATRTQTSQQVTYRERFNQVFAAGRRFYRPVLLCLRLLLFLRLFGLEIESKLHFVALSLVMMGIMLYQTNALQPYLEHLSRRVPNIHAQLPHAHPEVPPENNTNNNHNHDNNVEHDHQRPGIFSASVVMFLSSLVPNLHENWVQEDQRRSEHVQAVQRRLEQEQQEQEQRQWEHQKGTGQQEEDSESESRYFDPPPPQTESNTNTAST